MTQGFSEQHTDDVVRWEDRLNRQWPLRAQVSQWILQQILDQEGHPLRAVELACGAGYLAEKLVQQMHDVHYCGFDLSPRYLAYARRRLARYAAREGSAAEIHFRQADLNRSEWTTQLMRMGWAGHLDVVLSLQALHDLGGPTEQETVLHRAYQLLRPGGLLVYGDLLLDVEAPHPRRLTAINHEELLLSAGFAPEITFHELGAFGCFRCDK